MITETIGTGSDSMELLAREPGVVPEGPAGAAGLLLMSGGTTRLPAGRRTGCAAVCPPGRTECSGQCVNTDNDPLWASRFGIQGIPTLIIFKDGKEVDRVVGAVRKDVLKSKLEKVVAPVPTA